MPNNTPRRPGRPAPQAPEGVDLTAALSGDRVGVLSALRAYLAAILDRGVGPREVAPLVRRLAEVDAELRASTPDDQSAAERIRAQRDRRRAAAVPGDLPKEK